MFRAFHDRCGTGQRRVGLLQLGRRIDGATHLTGITVLILRAAFRAFTFDVAIGQEHVLDRIVELVDRACRNQPFITQATVNLLREKMIFRGVSTVPVVERNMKTIQVGFAP